MLQIDSANWKFLECTAPACLDGMTAVYAKNDPKASATEKAKFAVCNIFLTPINLYNTNAEAVDIEIKKDLTRANTLKSSEKTTLYQQQIAWASWNEYHGQDDYFPQLKLYFANKWCYIIEEFQKQQMSYNKATEKAASEQPKDLFTIWIPIKNTLTTMHFKLLTFVEYTTNKATNTSTIMITVSDRYIIRSPKNSNKTKMLYGNVRYYFQPQFAKNIYMTPFFNAIKWQNTSRTSNLSPLINSTCDKDLLRIIINAINILQPSGIMNNEPPTLNELFFVPTEADIDKACSSAPTLAQTENQLRAEIGVFKHSLAKHIDPYYGIGAFYSQPTKNLLGSTKSLSTTAKKTAQKLIDMFEGKFVMFEYEDLRVLNYGQLQPLLGKLQEITDPTIFTQLTTVQNHHPVVISSGNKYNDKVNQMLDKYINETQARKDSCFNARSFMGRLSGQHKTAPAKLQAAIKLQELINLNDKSVSGVTFTDTDIRALNDGELKMLLIQCRPPLINASTFTRLCNPIQKGNVIINAEGKIPIPV